MEVIIIKTNLNSKNKTNRTKIYFNKNKSNNFSIDYLIYIIFLFLIVACFFYG